MVGFLLGGTPTILMGVFQLQNKNKIDPIEKDNKTNLGHVKRNEHKNNPSTSNQMGHVIVRLPKQDGSDKGE